MDWTGGQLIRQEKTLYYLSVVKEKLLNHKTIELVYRYPKKYTSKSSEKFRYGKNVNLQPSNNLVELRIDIK